jgi:hypothetical protein
VALEVFAEGHVVAEPACFQVGDALAVEAQNVVHHAQEARRDQIPTLREQHVEIAAGVFEAAVFVAHAEAHRGRPAADPQLVEQGDEIGIGPVVENDKTRVDGEAPRTELHVHRRRVPAEALARLEYRDRVPGAEIVSTSQAGDAGTDYRNLHVQYPLWGRRWDASAVPCV